MMKTDRVGLVGWPTENSLPTKVVTHQLQVECRTWKVCRSKIDVLLLCQATNYYITSGSNRLTVALLPAALTVATALAVHLAGFAFLLVEHVKQESEFTCKTKLSFTQVTEKCTA